MGSIKKGAESFVKLCVNCNHSEFYHTKITKKDQSRISSSKLYLSECRQCKEEGKTCEMFKEIKEKKTSLGYKIKSKFRRI